MGIGKTSEQTQENIIDEDLRSESEALMSLFKILAGQEYQPNRGVTIAGFTPKQNSAFDMMNSAASAFGFGPQQANPMPQTETSAYGIQGYRPSVEYDDAVSRLPKTFRDALSRFYSSVGGSPAPQQETRNRNVDRYNDQERGIRWYERGVI